VYEARLIVRFSRFIPSTGIFFPTREDQSFAAKYTPFVINRLGFGT
jgi:hypothetical protein